MLCPICGKEFSEEEKICPVCGYAVSEEAGSNRNEACPLRPKKKILGKILGLSVTVLAVAAVVCGILFWENLQGVFLRTFSEPEEYYAYVMEKAKESNIRSFENNYKSFLESVKKREDTGFEAKIDLEIDEGISQILGNVSPDVLAAITDLSIRLESDTALSQGLERIRMALSSDGEAVASLEWIFSAQKGLYMTFPEQTEKYLFLPLSPEEVNLSVGTIDVEKMPSAEEIAAILDRYQQTIIQEILDAGVTWREGKYLTKNGTAVSCYEIEYTLTPEWMVECIKTLFYEMKDDSSLTRLWNDLRRAGALSADAPDFDDVMEELALLVKEMDADEMEGEIDVTAYVSARNELLGGRYEIEDVALVLFSTEEVFEVRLESEEVELFLTTETEDGKTVGEGKIKMEGQTLLSLTLQAEEDTATLRLSFGEGVSAGSVALMPTVVITAERGDEPSLMTELEWNNTALIRIKLRFEERAAQAITPPSESQVTEDEEQFFQSLDEDFAAVLENFLRAMQGTAPYAR